MKFNTEQQEKLAQIRNVIRMGHVTAIEPRRLLLEQGGVDMPDNTLDEELSRLYEMADKISM